MDANFISHKIETEKNENYRSFHTFEVDDSFFLFENLEKQVVNFFEDQNGLERDLDLNIIIYLIELMFKMINKKFIKKDFQSEKNFKKWLEKLASSNSLSKTKFLFYFLEKSIKWDNSFKNESECAICCSNNNELDDISMRIKAKCHQCDIVFHLNCLQIIKQTNQSCEDKFETDLFISNGKTELKCKAICFDCNLENEREILFEKENENLKMNNLNSIEKGSHLLRFNKSRVINHGNELGMSRKSSRINFKIKDTVIDKRSYSEDDDDDEYVPKTSNVGKRDEDFLVEETTESSSFSSEKENFNEMEDDRKNTHRTRKSSRINKKKRNVINSSSTETDSKQSESNKPTRARKNAKRVKTETVSSCFKKETLRPRITKINYNLDDGDNDEDLE